MSTPSELNRDLRSWLREDRHENADRVLLEALDTIATTDQRRTIWSARRLPAMNNVARIGLAAAAVVMIGLLGYLFIPRSNVGDTQPSATASPSPTPPPESFAEGTTSTGGRYLIELPHEQLDAVMTLEPGWTSGGWFINSPQGAVALFTPADVNTDACDQVGTLPNPPVGPTVAELLAALDSQENSEMSLPVDVTIDGVIAKRIELRPALDAPCDIVRWWKEPCCGEPELRGAETNAAAQESPDVVWVLEAEGQRVAVVGYWDHSNAEAGRAITDIVMSIDFVPRTDP